MFIDIHCHFNMLEDSAKRVATCKKNNVICVSAGTEPESNRAILALSKQYPEVKASLGMYPTHAIELGKKAIQKELDFIRQHAKDIVAISEIGIDLKELETLDTQQEVFEAFVTLAIELDKPVIVHSRKAEKECIEVLEKLKATKVVMHCFSGNFKLVKRIVENGWTCSIPTCVKHAQHFQKMIEEIPIEQLLCETDSPYLHPDKEFPNEPANVIASYEMIAKLKKMKLSAVEKQLEKNYKRLFD